jgi:hypothetical protein
LREWYNKRDLSPSVGYDALLEATDALFEQSGSHLGFQFSDLVSSHQSESIFT